ncbi:MAG: ABC transporter permease [Oscillospiraceae bacterium]
MRQKRLYSMLSYVLVAVIALALSVLMIFLVGSDVGQALSGFVGGIFGSSYSMAEVFVKVIPLTLCGLGVAVGFRSGFTNIGAEGQLYMGAIAITWVGMYWNLPPWLMFPVALVLGALAGGIWALIPGILKARFGISEVINTIMFNYIAVNIVGILVQTKLKDPANYFPMSAVMPKSLSLPILLPGTRLHMGLLIALVCIVLMSVLLFKTRSGYNMRAVGLNSRACQVAGISVPKSLLLSALLSGGLAGIAGVCEIAGLQHKLLEGISPSYGYLAIIVALLGKNHPVGVFFAAIGIACLQVGSLGMQRTAGVPSAIASIIMGIVVLLILARKTLFAKLLAREGE